MATAPLSPGLPNLRLYPRVPPSDTEAKALARLPQTFIRFWAPYIK
jgi:hypothetical protein